ncbi:MAG: UDP-N-acetylmuramoyl-tripeptide--D-alanyl-D-alanine ligase [Bacilli bacterium]|nr:UDP-N-acetylmuramoyl-tripeptide--D-alanyl-D-alanine ligase [Bacilli bacterium]
MLIKFIVSIIPVIPYIFLKSKKSLHMLQQNWYNDGNRYLKWINNNKKKVFNNIDILFIVFIFGLFINKLLLMTLFIIFYCVISLLYLKKIKNEKQVKPLVFTKRVKRLVITTYLIYILLILISSLTFNEEYLTYYYLIFGLAIYLNYFVVYLANILNKPIEKMINNNFKRKAIKKLNNMSNMKVIGITGSYGKTSSKNILNDILNVKYNSFPTPKNFNTPLGLIITINNYLDKFNDLFIAEMGAFKKGEIKELCDLVHPTYGILTKIGVAHLESFGSQENIQQGKFELIESLPSDGIGILNFDDPLQVNYKLKNNCKIVTIGIDNKDVDVRATDIKLTNSGTTFNVLFKGDKTKYKFETKLLGKANVYNILAGIALGYNLNISIEQLMIGVKKVKPVEHRLELKKMGNINIIDDAYNANPDGTKMALDVLNSMPGKKIVISSGMIELGSKEYELNEELGEYMKDRADQVILLGKELTKPIYDGLIKTKFKKENIFVLNDIKEAIELIKNEKEDTYVLIQSDLPDIFN